MSPRRVNETKCHVPDIHLDSPLLSLEEYPGAPVAVPNETPAVPVDQKDSDSGFRSSSRVSFDCVVKR
jgi:hypothetical protein